MPGTLVQSLTGTAANTTNPPSTAFSIATTTGNRLIVGLMTDASGVANYTTSISGGGVTTFTRDASVGQVVGSNLDISMDIWSGPITAGATTALTFGFSPTSATRLVWLIQEWSGLAGFDKASALATGTSTAALSGTSGTLAQADSVAFGLVEWRTGTSTPSAGATYSTPSLITNGSATTSAVFGAMEAKQVAATTAVTADFGLGTSRKWGCLVAVYSAAATYTGRPRPQVPMLRM